MQKDFDHWNTLKKKLDSSQPHFYFHEREVWWTSLGLNIGDEQDGKNRYFERPVLILKKFNNRVALVLPLTTTNKTNLFVQPIYASFLKRKSFIILSQIRLISTKRLLRREGRIDSLQFSRIQQRLIFVLFTK